MELSTIILTGGKNQRMGRNKALEILEGKSLLERVYERVSQVSAEVIVVTSSRFPDIPGAEKFRVVTDTYPEKGPLGGIFTGLTASGTEKNLVVGCDMPFLNVELLRYLSGLSADFDAVVPMLEEGMREPLHSVYSRRCATMVEEHLLSGRLSIHLVIDRLKVRYVTREEILRFDPELLSFFDINYQSDIERATLIARDSDAGN
jgi:molybdopterin-guanine dinucleotide biosynthesis protein A